MYFLAGFFLNLTLCMTKLRVLVLSFPDFTKLHIEGRRGREAFSFHPSVLSSIHGWHHLTRPSIPPVIHPWMASYREENPGRNK
jgi:hypothetical protein